MQHSLLVTVMITLASAPLFAASLVQITQITIRIGKGGRWGPDELLLACLKMYNVWTWTTRLPGAI